MNVFGLIPAAGLSVRMGRPKLTLPLGDRSILERVIDCLREGGVARTLVVIGPSAPELVDLAIAGGAAPLLLGDQTPDMRSTVEAGLRWIERSWRPTAGDAFLLAPADHPALAPAVVQRLLAVPGDGIVIPTFERKRGHPARVGWSLVPDLLNWPAGFGLNDFFRANAVVEMSADTRDILDDIDTPEEYERWRARLA
jgi:CTP:molybdopterin cytidylyltransferase MocA